MSSVTFAPADRTIYRTSVMFCVLPMDLSRHVDGLQRYCADLEGIEIVVERRGVEDRRRSSDGAPDGVERRVGDRRDAAAGQSAAELDFELPRSLRRHAGRIICARRSVPVHFQDAAREADLLLAASGTDSDARDELRLRNYQRVYASLGHAMSSGPRKVVLTDAVFDDLFAHHESTAFSRELGRATSRVVTTYRSHRRRFAPARASG